MTTLPIVGLDLNFSSSSACGAPRDTFCGRLIPCKVTCNDCRHLRWVMTHQCDWCGAIVGNDLSFTRENPLRRESSGADVHRKSSLRFCGKSGDSECEWLFFEEMT